MRLGLSLSKGCQNSNTQFAQVLNGFWYFNWLFSNNKFGYIAILKTVN